MSENDLEVAILMADISGSSALYEDVGDTNALRLVGICLDNLRAIVEREGGTFIRSKGDDVLAIFADASAALAIRSRGEWTSSAQNQELTSKGAALL